MMRAGSAALALMGGIACAVLLDTVTDRPYRGEASASFRLPAADVAVSPPALRAIDAGVGNPSATQAVASPDEANPRLARIELSLPRRGERYRALVEAAAREYALDSALLHAVIATESAYDPRAVSPKGAAGLMQLMPETARRYGVSDRFDPGQNIRAGARYLRDLLARFDNDIALSLAAYNAGERAVIERGYRIPPYKETMQYVPTVLARYRELQGLPDS